VIERIQGVLAGKGPTSALLQIGPVCLELAVPLSTARRLPEDGEPAAFWTHLIWREEGPSLYGFRDRQERDLFRLLLGVQGVGPAGALSLLSHLPPAELVRQIRDRSVEGLTRVPRIGQKTAGRILVDLGPKADQMVLEGAAADEGAPAPQAAVEDAVQALTALGYAAREARRAVEEVHREDPEAPLHEAIRRALHRLTRRD